jgi:hypothetical protein
MNHQKVRTIIDAGLELYAEIAGWLTRAAEGAKN